MPMSNINLNNATYNAFVQFAERANSGSTIARLGGTLANRTIEAAGNGDFVGNVFRGSGARDVNHAARMAFLGAVGDIFGGLDKVPSSVRDAMKIADFGLDGGSFDMKTAEDNKTCKPLTARRIQAINAAIQDYALGARNVDLAVDRMNVKLSPEQHDAAVGLLSKFGGRFPDGKNADLFANFIVRLPLTAGSKVGDEALARDMADSISGWSDVEAGDESMKGFTDLCMKEFNKDIASRFEGDGLTAHYGNSTIHDALREDLPRNNYKIGDSECPKSAYAGKTSDEKGKIANGMIEKFKEILPNLAHQRGISAIFHQSLGSIAQKAATRHAFDRTGQAPHDPRIVNRNEASGLYVQEVFLKNAKNVSYELQVDDLGKSGVITAKFDRFTLNVCDARNAATIQTPFGQMSMTMELKLNLEGNIPRIEGFSVGQTLHTDIQ